MNKERVIVESVKGISELKINELDFSDLVMKKVISIYGANGAGKSSLKEAISKEKPSPNWNGERTQKVDPLIIKTQTNLAVFDEQLVKLVRGVNKGSPIVFLNKNVGSLFELLSDRESSITSASQQVPNFNELLKIEKSFFENGVETLKKSLENLEQIKDILSKAYKLTQYETINAINAQFSQKLSHVCGLLYNSNSFGYDQNTENMHSPILSGVLKIMNTELKKKELSAESVNNVANGIKDLLELFDCVFEIQQNFGYKKPENETRRAKQTIMKIAMLNYNLKYPFFNSLFSITDEQVTKFEEIWARNSLLVDYVVKRANEFLEVYNLDYDVELNKTTLAALKNNKTNFGLRHKTSNISLSVDEIEDSVSFGELNIISLSLFIASILSRREDGQDISIIFDDPVSSYDLNRIHISLNIINNWLLQKKWLKQIFFISHEKYFIKLTKRLLPDETAVFTLMKGDVSKLIRRDSVSSDLDFVSEISKNHQVHILTRAVALRQLIEIKGVIGESKDLHKLSLLSDIVHYRIEKLKDAHANVFGISLEELKTKTSEEPNWDIPENMMALRSWLSRLGINIESMREVTKGYGISIENPLTEEQIVISQLASLELVLDGISHFNEATKLNHDISRLEETIDVLFANRKKILELVRKVKNDYDELSNKDSENEVVIVAQDPKEGSYVF